MRKDIFFLFVAISCFIQMHAGLPKVWDLTLNKSSMVLYVGQSETLVPSYMTTLSSVSFTWKSSSTYVATVDQNGRVTAQSPGTTRITCSYSDGETTEDDKNNLSLLTESCKIKLDAEDIEYIFVKDNSDIHDVVSWIDKVFSTGSKANKKVFNLLKSRILTVKQIRDDF